MDVDTRIPVQGYLDEWEVRPGQSLVVRTSCQGEHYQARIVRVVGGAPRGDGGPDAPRWVPVPAACAGAYPARPQRTLAGSYGVAAADVEIPRSGFGCSAWIMSTLPAAGRPQTVVSLHRPAGWLALGLTADGTLALTWDDGGNTGELRVREPLRPYTWYFVAAGSDGTRASVFQRELAGAGRRPGEPRTVTAALAVPAGTFEQVRVGVLDPNSPADDRQVTTRTGAFNGKIEAPTITGSAPDLAHWARAATGPAAPAGQPRWSADFAADQPGLRLAGAPMRRMTGHAWTGEHLDWRLAPEQWGAIWFHDDDLADAGWDEAFRWEVPAGTQSGLYAVRLHSDLGEDLVPFFVTAADRPAAPVAVLVPTFTYTAYSNFPMVFPDESPYRTSETTRFLDDHPELGLSMYSRHRDGSGVSHVSWRRPMLDMRLDRRLPTRGNAGREVSGDLFLLEWLETQGIPYEIVTDRQLHAGGAGAVRDYRCVITGAHPEYVSRQILDALQTYVDDGGRLMYLGGNGFYWVTTVDPAQPHVIEVRRGRSGSRTWTGLPGEQTHADPAEPGGHWRDRGRAPQVLTGVGFCAQGGGSGAGYVRLPDSYRDDCAFVFAGIGRDEVIGEFGAKQNAAAADELDRLDASLGSPAGTLLLATSAGRHDRSYQHAIEEVEEMNPREGGDQSPLVRADMTLYTNGNGGSVFSVGSIAWTASLSHNGGDNNVARITRNVIHAFR